MVRGKKGGGNQDAVSREQVSRPDTKRRKRLSAVMVFGIVISLLVSGVILAQRGRGGHSVKPRSQPASQQELNQVFAPATAANPSREYIYAGARLLATEEPPGVSTHSLTVASQNPSSGVTITASPTDSGGLGTGSTPFSRTYAQSTAVTLTAPATAGGHNFQKWLRNGADFGINQTANVTVDTNLTMTAIYGGSAGAGTDTIGLYDPAGSVFYLSTAPRNKVTGQAATLLRSV